MAKMKSELNWTLVNDYPPKPVHELMESIIQLNNPINISRRAWSLLRFGLSRTFRFINPHTDLQDQRITIKCFLSASHSVKITAMSAINISIHANKQKNDLLCEWDQMWWCSLNDFTDKSHLESDIKIIRFFHKKGKTCVTYSKI